MSMFGKSKQPAGNTAVVERPTNPGGIQVEPVTEVEVDERVEFARLAGRMLSRGQIRAELQAQHDAAAVEKFNQRPTLDAGVQKILIDRAEQEGASLELPALRKQFAVLFDELEAFLRTNTVGIGAINQMRGELDRVRQAALNSTMSIGGSGLRQRIAQKMLADFPALTKSYS